MVFKQKNKKIILIVGLTFVILLVGVGIYLLTRNKISKKNSENKEERVLFKGKGDKIESLVEFREKIDGKWYTFTKENEMSRNRLIFVHKDNPIFLTINPNPGSFYYLKILKSKKGQNFFEKNDYVELSRK